MSKLDALCYEWEVGSRKWEVVRIFISFRLIIQSLFLRYA